MKTTTAVKLINYWPPFFGTGIRVKNIAPDFRSLDVELRPWPFKWLPLNMNLHGTHFGGSITAMTDGFNAMMLLHNLGPEYDIWDKAASIQFQKPGTGILTAHFSLAQEQIDNIRMQADKLAGILREDGKPAKAEPHFIVTVLNEAGKVVAEANRTISVRRKTALCP